LPFQVSLQSPNTLCELKVGFVNWKKLYVFVTGNNYIYNIGRYFNPNFTDLNDQNFSFHHLVNV
jgi:hypothetical protein